MTTLTIFPTGAHEPSPDQIDRATACALHIFRVRGLTLDVIEHDKHHPSIRHKEIRRAWRVAFKDAMDLCGTHEIDMRIIL